MGADGEQGRAGRSHHSALRGSARNGRVPALARAASARDRTRKWARLRCPGALGWLTAGGGWPVKQFYFIDFYVCVKNETVNMRVHKRIVLNMQNL